MSIRVRKSIHSLGNGSPEIDYYRKAVDALQKLPIGQIGSWEYIAACHGIPMGQPVLPTGRGLWGQCQHQTWFFLSWHRAYLAGFEAIIAEQVAKLGGPADWALPYWNYSDPIDPHNPGAERELPLDFRSPTMPDGSPNALWAPRRLDPPNTVVTLDAPSVSLAAMSLPHFSSPVGSKGTSFGGPETASAQHSGSHNGGIEEFPHNHVHDDLGGYMSLVETAALDPIFWLHHANIDRLWELWRGSVPPPADPTASDWLTTVSFNLVTAGAKTFTFTSQQALDTKALLHGYIYDTVPHVAPAASPIVSFRRRGASPVAAISAFKTVADLVGRQQMTKAIASGAGSIQSIELGADWAQTTVTVDEDHRSALQTTRQPTSGRYFLHIENITASGPARRYDIYMGVRGLDRPNQLIGRMSSFGVANASRRDGSHDGGGLVKVFDVTEAIRQLVRDHGAFPDLAIGFSPVATGQIEDVPPGFPHAELLKVPPADLTIGAIRIYVE